MKRINIKIIAGILLIATGMFFSGCGCKETNPKKYKLSLEIWGTTDSGDALSEIFTNYIQMNPNISEIKYRKIAADTYRNELLEALASGKGPDIFLINNNWLEPFRDKISEAPQIPGSGIINEQKFRVNFMDVAINDFVEEGKIYATPLSVDSLALYYNKDLFNQAGITEPPKTWEEFSSYVQRLTKLNAFNEVIQAGAAIGTAKNINRSTDILNMLMIQSGAEMADENGRITFDSAVFSGGETVSPGESALSFYTQFAKSGSLYYTWNNNLHYSLDAFSEGSLAMMFNYSWHLKTIKDKAPKLNFSVAPVPQFPNRPKANYANYWAFAVAKNKVVSKDSSGAPIGPQATNDERIAEAWLFLTYLTTKPDGSFRIISSGGSPVGRSANPNLDPAKSYLSTTGEPAARRDLIEEQKTDPVIGVFAESNLVSKSWKQKDSHAIENIFAEMIENVYQGKETVVEAIQVAARRAEMLSRQ